MSEPATPPADDGYERHYAEKIWSLVPGAHRDADGLAPRPGQLRALVEVLAEQAAVARRSIDRLWSDTAVDTADDWAIPYLGALVGARPVSALNRAGQRTAVARAVLYRRRAGTTRLAELLADDIADWDAVTAEAFLRLHRCWHLLDGPPVPGRATGSPRWGYPDLRSVRVADVLDGPFDDLAHRPDLRRHRGGLGRYGIAKVNLHVFRQYALTLIGVTPYDLGGGLFTLDPSGRDRPLFQVGGRVPEDCGEVPEWQVRGPIPCRRLAAAGFRLRAEDAPAGLAAALTPLAGRGFATEAAFLRAVRAAAAAAAPPVTVTDEQAAELLAAGLKPDSPRRNLLPGGDPQATSVSLAVGAAPDAEPLGPERLYAADLSAWGVDAAPPGWVRGLVDPALGRVRLTAAPAAGERLHVHRVAVGAFLPVGAGTHDRGPRRRPVTAGVVVAGDAPELTAPLSGELRFPDSRTVTPVLRPDGVVEVDGDLRLVAENGRRPYVVLGSAGGGPVRLRATAPDVALEVDGLWLGVADGGGELVLEGTWRRVTFRDVTLDPGGPRAAGPGAPAATVPAVTLVLTGAIGDLVVERCVTGRVVEPMTGPDPCATDTVTVTDSVVDGSGDPSGPALLLRTAALRADRCTVLGDLVAGRLDATHLLVDGQLRVEDRQTSCLRFSAAAGGALPRPYECHVFPGGLPPTTFVSRRYGDPGYVQLTETAPPGVRGGGELGTEIGAFHRALDPVKRADLRAKLDELMPLNAVVQLVLET